MKKLVVPVIVSLACITLSLVLLASPAFAGGDQNCNRHRGDVGQGAVIQNQIRNND